MKKMSLMFVLLLSAGAFAQSLPDFTGPGPGSQGGMPGQGMMSPYPNQMPGTFTIPQQRQMGEQPAYAQTIGQGCQPRGYTGPTTGPIMPNGIPAQVPYMQH